MCPSNDQLIFVTVFLAETPEEMSGETKEIPKKLKPKTKKFCLQFDLYQGTNIEFIKKKQECYVQLSLGEKYDCQFLL